MSLPCDYSKNRCSDGCPWSEKQGKQIKYLTAEERKALHSCKRYHCFGCNGIGSCTKPRTFNTESTFCVEGCNGNHSLQVCTNEQGTLFIPYAITASEWNTGEKVVKCHRRHCETLNCPNDVIIQSWDKNQERRQCWSCLSHK